MKGNMNKNKLASQLCELEGKKSQVKIGNMRETLRCLEVVIAQDALASGERDPLYSPIVIALCERAKKRLDALWKRADRAARRG